MAEIAPLDEQILSLFSSSAERPQALVRDLSEADLDVRSEIDGWTAQLTIRADTGKELFEKVEAALA